VALLRIKRGDGETAPRQYPYVEKQSVLIKILMPLFILTGRVHYAGNQCLSDVLNWTQKFLPPTNVNICPERGEDETGVSFVAVNKGQTIYAQEL